MLTALSTARLNDFSANRSPLHSKKHFYSDMDHSRFQVVSVGKIRQLPSFHQSDPFDPLITKWRPFPVTGDQDIFQANNIETVSKIPICIRHDDISSSYIPLLFGSACPSNFLYPVMNAKGTIYQHMSSYTPSTDSDCHPETFDLLL